MSLTEEKVQDKIEIVSDYKFVQVRNVTIVKRDGIEIARNLSRYIITPADDISGESEEVQVICNAAHTDAVKASYAAHLEAVKDAYAAQEVS